MQAEQASAEERTADRAVRTAEADIGQVLADTVGGTAVVASADTAEGTVAEAASAETAEGTVAEAASADIAEAFVAA